MSFKSLLRKAADYLYTAGDLLLLPSKASVLPRHVQLDITTRCNLRCKMCYGRKVMHPSEANRDFTFAQFRELFDRIQPLSVNLAASGEPLLNADVFEMIRYAHERGCTVIIATNFTVPDHAMIDRIIDSGLDIMKISIDGADAEVYASVRGPHFERLCANLEYLLEARRRKGSAGPSVRFDYVMLKSNYMHVDRIIELAARSGVGHVFYRLGDARGWDDEEKRSLLAGIYGELEKKMAAARELASRHGIQTNLDELLARREWWRSRYEDPLKKEECSGRPVCMLPWMQLFVSVLGDTSYCCSIYPSHDANQGNIGRRTVPDLWNGPGMQKVRALFREKRNYDLFEGCRYCIPVSRGSLWGLVRMFPGFLRRRRT